MPGELPESKVDRNIPSIKTPIVLPSGKWNFSTGHIFINGQNISELIEHSPEKPIEFWAQLSGDLNAFINQTLRRFGKKRKKKVGSSEVEEDIDPNGELGRLVALGEAYIAKIMRLMKRKYDEKTDGISYMLDEDGQLTLNGTNIHAFIHMAKQYPSQKARLFLQGLKNRLGIILSNKSGNSNYEKIREATLALFKDIDEEVNRITEKERLIEKT